MDLEILRLVWPVLLVLFYFMTVMFVKVLNGHFIGHTRMHDVVREAKLRRNAYLKSLHDREEGLEIED